MTLRSIPIWTLSLAVLPGWVCAAHAQVMKIDVAPSPAIIGRPATVTVTGGQAPCGAVEINYGDGVALTYPISGLPFVQGHTWTTLGKKAVVATGHGDCTGQATVTIEVSAIKLGPPPRLGVNTSPPPRFSLPMRIKSYFGVSQPGGLAAIAGENFGAERGTVVAKLRRWNGAALEVPLRVNDWSPTLIEVAWPADINSVRDQMDAIVEAADATKMKKASWKVFFRAETDYRLLPKSDARVMTCSNGGNYNSCNGIWHADACALGAPPGAPVPNCAGSLHGYHANCWATVGNDSGTDQYEVRLRNDWVISSVDFQKGTGGGEGAVGNPSPPAPIGSAAWNPRVKWEVTPNDAITYCGFVHISGPKGVPFK